MVTLREGLQMFQQGMGQLGEGMEKSGEYKRRRKGAEALRDRPDEDFEGGETGKRMALASMVGGKEEVAAKLMAAEPQSPAHLMTKLTNQFIKEQDPNKKAAYGKMMEVAMEKLRPILEYQRSVQNNYGPNVPTSAYTYEKVKLKDVLNGISSPPSKTILGIERDKKEYESEMQQWKNETQLKLKNNIINKTAHFPEESQNMSYNLAWDMINNNRYGDNIEKYLEENPDATFEVPVISQMYIKGRGTVGPVTKPALFLHTDTNKDVGAGGEQAPPAPETSTTQELFSPKKETEEEKKKRLGQ